MSPLVSMRSRQTAGLRHDAILSLNGESSVSACRARPWTTRRSVVWSQGRMDLEPLPLRLEPGSRFFPSSRSTQVSSSNTACPSVGLRGRTVAVTQRERSWRRDGARPKAARIRRRDWTRCTRAGTAASTARSGKSPPSDGRAGAAPASRSRWASAAELGLLPWVAANCSMRWARAMGMVPTQRHRKPRRERVERRRYRRSERPCSATMRSRRWMRFRSRTSTRAWGWRRDKSWMARRILPLARSECCLSRDLTRLVTTRDEKNCSRTGCRARVVGDASAPSPRIGSSPLPRP
mmetsp:Transcript_11171/g.32068  ORF Transcript_11171/g.32068 Transcript_11171/m.32068 type:complete len:293 (-) Transcript_11171:1368-2246(-)